MDPSPFAYRDGRLHAEGVPLERIAEAVGTPFYCYSHAYLAHRAEAYEAAFGELPHLTCFSVKACSNLAVLALMARRGLGFDIVSGGELARCLAAGADPATIVYSGVGKTAAEMRQALEAGIRCFNVESQGELALLDRVAGELGVRAPVALRVNPDVDPQTHPYISTGLKENKFGISHRRALEAYREAAELPHVEVVGIDCHIGSQLTTLTPFLDALDRLLALVVELREAGIELRHLDLGGGLGIRYRDESPPAPETYVAALADRIAPTGLTLILEPGRSIAGNAGCFVTRCLYTKENEGKRFVVVDGGMNDLVRPSLYGAYQEILPLAAHPERPERIVDVVGPICETGDFLARGRPLPVVRPGELLAVMSAGAYGFSMASTYNTRPRVPEVLVQGDRFHVIRRRETVEELLAPESIPEGI
ncbi:MAG: diaminopimelate decarboxylase [Nitrospirae bacterium]|nr:MAG: diaminopimelate decarboxylase [Nitrospirota bacterium]